MQEDVCEVYYMIITHHKRHLFSQEKELKIKKRATEKLKKKSSLSKSSYLFDVLVSCSGNIGSVY